MKVVFDTNIFISALIFPNSQAEKAIFRIIDGVDTLILSHEIINEVLSVLAAKFSKDREALARVAVNLAGIAVTVQPKVQIAVLVDEPDNRILECAVAGNAEVIVTGDKAMLALGNYNGITILSLREYLLTE